MHHEHVKKLNFNLLNHPQSGWGGGGCVQHISYHVAEFVIPFHFIYTMTIFEKYRINFDLLTHPQSGGEGRFGHICMCYHVVAFHILFNLICNMNML